MPMLSACHTLYAMQLREEQHGLSAAWRALQQYRISSLEYLLDTVNKVVPGLGVTTSIVNSLHGAQPLPHQVSLLVLLVCCDRLAQFACHVTTPVLRKALCSDINTQRYITLRICISCHCSVFTGCDGCSRNAEALPARALLPNY